ncbi:uncharacterized protein FA14DRAFT_170058 [Meira miltonrushii]|uniref:BHLH domain-containing protein n=1 Tax=Meira miltonrushii TaxID=1280837 RepID=A0A316VI11_9BASI|nr:uncharacterized protein FA14DRAFT_170058 [Meira miltonrushii]PWN37176.1 hypothetical protein FA14DRAFT_170058 [Meira miltonrushii]
MAALAEFPSVLQQKQKDDQTHFDNHNNHHDLSSTQGAKAYREHLAEIQRRSQLHSALSNDSSLFASSHKGLSQAEMMAAQQHLGFSPIQQIKSERSLDDSGMISPQDQTQWQDDQEQFLRNLLSTPLEDVSHSMSSTSGASFHSQSPPQPNPGSISGDDAGRYSSLSPVSSTGYQSLHDFIHGGSISSSSTASGNGMPFGGFPTPPDGDAKGSALHLSHLKQDPMSNQYDYAQGQHPGLMDAGAINFFMNTIANQNGQQIQDQQKFTSQVPPHIMAQHMAMHGNHNISLPMNINGTMNANSQMPMQSFASDNQQFNFQAPGGMQSNFNGLLNQQAQMQQYPMDPSTDPRKRSAPMPSTSNDALLHEQMQTNAQPNNKRPRKLSAKEAAAQQHQQQQQQSSVPLYGAMHGATSFMPRMEVGSNATALAAIERLKAKKRAEQEMKAQNAKLEEQHKSNRMNAGMMNNGIGSSSNGMPIIKSEKKVAHNAIERRYRNNINARIAALRNAVPALHELRPKRPTRRGKEAPPEDLVDGVPAATKLNKATILGKATEYIRYLKGRETRLVSEVAGLRELIRSLEGGEELLDLWQGEMERVVAEQEAIARAAFALEDDSLDIGDDEDEEDDEDDMEPHKISRSPASNRSSSSRYMMGIFMGFSILGGGAEVLHNENAASTSTSYSPAGHAHHVLRASSGRVIGASHQLLKRGMQATNVKFGTLAHEPHHFDHVPHHLLIVEVLRGATLIACLVFIFWPLISSFLPRQEPEKPMKRRRQSNKPVFIQENEASIALERKKMLMILADSASSPHQVDLAMRKFVRAPNGVVSSTLSLVTLSVKEILHRSGLSPRVKRSHDEERAAIWSRLLELETSLGPLAQRSLLARMHTLLTVSTSSFVGFGTQSGLPLLHPARVYGTLAIALVRASSSNAIVTSFADRYWTMARRCRLLAADGGVDENNVTQVTDRWLDPVLELSLVDAVSLCPIPTQIASFFSQHSDSNTRATMVSPLLCIAASQHSKQLATIWSTLLCQIAKTTCPSNSVSSEQGDDHSRSPTCADFVKHHAGVKIALPILNDLGDRDRLTSQITRLTLTAPRCPRLQIICNVTFGTWALLLGNGSVAKDVAVALARTGEEEVLAMPACAKAFIALVLGGGVLPQKGKGEDGEVEIADILQKSLSVGAVPMNEADALAAATLSWLSFLRTLSTYLSEDSTKTDGNKIAQSTISIRRLLASARACRPILTEESLIELRDASPVYAKQYPSGHRDSLASTLSTAPSVTVSEAGSITNEYTAKLAAQHNFDDALDTLTDILAVLGKRAASGGEFSKEKLLQPDENVDSGVEWTL